MSWDRLDPLAAPGGILLVRGGGDPFGFDAAEATTRSVYAVLGVDVSEQLRVDHADEPGAVARRTDVLEAARNLGSRLVDSTAEAPV